MPIPPAVLLATLPDCASYTKTVEPYLSHLAHPLGLTEVRSLATLKDLYMHTNPLIAALAFAIATFPIFFIVSEANKNYSQVDRVWSILPTVFNAHYALWTHLHGLPTERVDNVLAVSVVWSLRLTFNYWRKGGYSVGSEDYRWLIVQSYIGKVGFTALNVLFISTTQILVLWAITAPTYLLMLVSRIQPGMTTADYVFSRGILALVVFEYFADGQQWVYHQAKAAYRETAKVPAGWTRAQMERGFITTGLWRYSRHPNFAAEQTVWIVLYMWGCWATYTPWNWTFVGMFSYLMVFQGSTPLTEWISGSKYPEYRVYRERVGRFVPSVLGMGWDEAEMEVMGKRIAEGEKKRKQVNGGKKE